MAKQRHLSKAPIIEAIIDLQVHPLDVTLDVLSGLGKALLPKYPNRVDRRRWSSEITVKAGQPSVPVTQDFGIVGYQYATKDGSEVVQFRLDGFTYSKLKPYTDWNQFRAEAFACWQNFAKLDSTVRVKRVAARFINVLDIPTPIQAYEDYLTSLPPTPKDMDLGLVSFLNQIDVVDQKGEFRAMISQALQPQRTPAVSSILLDIDVFKDSEFELDYAGAWKAIDRFQKVKNDIFFHLITEKMAEILE